MIQETIRISALKTTETASGNAAPGEMSEEFEVWQSSASTLASLKVFDGFADIESLKKVLRRVFCVATVYAVASSMLVFALARAFSVDIFGWGPGHFAASNFSFVFFFTGIMLPVALILGWHYRYERPLPYQQQRFTLNLLPSEAFEQALAGVLSLPGTSLRVADQEKGLILCDGRSQKQSRAQQISLSLLESSPGQTEISICSKAKLNAIESLLFGFTLSPDGGVNLANVERISNFLKTSS